LDRRVRLVHAIVRPTVNSNSRFPTRCFRRVHLALCFERARDLDAEVTLQRRTRLVRLPVQEDIVSVSPESRLAPKECPDLIQSRPPGGGNGTGWNVAPDGS
jgi:hypothetical protein